MKIDYRALTPTGKCTICGINCWEQTDSQPAIWPCGLDGCPYPQSAKVIQFEKSSTGSSLLGIN
jgi:hypothetical protein